MGKVIKLPNLKLTEIQENLEPVELISIDENGLLSKTPFEAHPDYIIDIIANELKLYKNGDEIASKDLSIYLDDSNLSRLISGVIDEETGIVTFTRDDQSTFTIDMSNLIGGTEEIGLNSDYDFNYRLDSVSDVDFGNRIINTNLGNRF